MSNLFKHAAMFTDLHLGHKHNSREHNQDCIDYIDWFISESKKRNCETCFCLGDFHHHRNTLNVVTINYSMEVIRKLNNSFNNVYMIVGNHDNFYRANRDVNSLAIGAEFKNIHIIDSVMISGDVAIVPWLVDDEWRKIKNIKTKYMMGHFEIPGFKMNAMVDMPDHGTLNAQHFENQEYVFSGHFHKRQSNYNVHYIGNAFPHNYGDSWDFERGAMFLKWNKKPEYVNWPDCPRYITTTLSDLLDEKNTDKYLQPKTFARINVDLDISYEEAGCIRETFMTDYDIRELKLIPAPKERIDQEFEGEIKFKTVDEIVHSQLANIESETYDNKILIQLYNNL